jgi:hypothetical protein
VRRGSDKLRIEHECEAMNAYPNLTPENDRFPRSADPKAAALCATAPPPPVPARTDRVHPMNRKRRTVLWLYNEDYEYLSAVADHDMDTKNISMHRLVKALRHANVKSFLKLEEFFRRLPPPKA